MSKLRLGLAVVFALILIPTGAFVYKYECDKAAWADVQAKLIRLNSGLQYEPNLALRSQIADTDAAVKVFASEPRIFPLDHAQRVQYSEKAVAYLALAAEYQLNGASDTEPTTNSAHMESLEQFPDVTTFVPRTCIYGHVAFSRKDAAAGSAQIGYFMLRRAEGEPLGSGAALKPKGNFAVLDLANESVGCSYQERRR
jgi:hypothetical protein